ncbi:hypothetical protein NN3_37420 [Nocardia neocaledoniensis NBRC 108232]|nr:hypothetical protein NN3_37420 [Nocardia neocaledoniensis NBRC 108232]
MRGGDLDRVGAGRDGVLGVDQFRKEDRLRSEQVTEGGHGFIVHRAVRSRRPARHGAIGELRRAARIRLTCEWNVQA